VPKSPKLKSKYFVLSIYHFKKILWSFSPDKGVGLLVPIALARSLGVQDPAVDNL